MLILGYAATLRLDALARGYGPHASPAWLHGLETVSTRMAPHVVPDGWTWTRDPNPDGEGDGDPKNYLRFARDMHNFYRASVREPVYPAAVKAALVLTGGADVALRVASLSFSMLIIVATYLVGREAVSRPAGLAAAAVLAIDRVVIEWSVGGWRDEACAFFGLLAVWLWLRVARRPTVGSATAAGVATGLACLARLTAPFMLAAAVLSPLIAGVRGPRPAIRLVLIGSSVAAVLVAPYLVSCALAFGDPFYAVNYHTQFYLGREGATPEIMHTGRYLMAKFLARPYETADIALQGLFVHPFVVQWRGIDVWWSGLGTALAWLSAAGLAAWLFVPRGRLLLGVLLGSLVPYMITWSIPGGGEWRFTLHAYPFYLLAAFGFVGTLATAARSLTRARPDWRVMALRSAALVALGAAGLVWWWGMPVLVAREALRQGRGAVVIAGSRDGWLLGSGWTRLSVTGNVTARFGTGEWSEIVLPLPESRDYGLVLRVDPIPRDDLPAQRLHVELNGATLGQLELSWNPDRVGAYELAIPRRLVRPGANVLRLRADALVGAGPVVDRYPALRPDDLVGFRFWALVIRPIEPGGADRR